MDYFIFGVDTPPDWFTNADERGDISYLTKFGRVIGCIVDDTDVYTLGDIIYKSYISKH